MACWSCVRASQRARVLPRVVAAHERAARTQFCRSGSGRLHADESEEESSEGASGSDCRWKGLTLTFVSASTRSRVPCVSEWADFGVFASVESPMSPHSGGKHWSGALT